MDFRIADTFTDSLAKLPGNKQKAVKMMAFDMQLNLVNPRMNFRKHNMRRDKSFCFGAECKKRGCL